MAPSAWMSEATVSCPTRRPAVVYPVWDDPRAKFPNYSLEISESGKTDYAANGGDTFTDASYNGSIFNYAGPDHWNEAESAAGQESWGKIAALSNGVFYAGSEIRVADIDDGLSNTYMLGEKFLNPDCYFVACDHGDNENFYVGDNQDLVRWTSNSYGDPLTPRQDLPGYGDAFGFGSAHPAGLNMALCDGSIRSVSYTIDVYVHRYLSNRKDGQVIGGNMF